MVFSEEGRSGLVERLAAGDPEAARVVVEQLGRRLVGLASQRLVGPARSRTEPEDVVQSVFRSFFGRLNRGDYELGGWGELWALLVVITIRKCRKQHRRWTALRRRATADQSQELLDLTASDPAPEAAVLLTELIQTLFEALAPPEQAILELSLQGYSSREIAERLSRSERTVQRVRQAVRDDLRRRLLPE